jgi:hypothetical protein
MDSRCTIVATVFALVGCHLVFPYSGADQRASDAPIAPDLRADHSISWETGSITEKGGVKDLARMKDFKTTKEFETTKTDLATTKNDLGTVVKDGGMPADVAPACPPAGTTFGHDTVTAGAISGLTLSWKHTITSSGRVLTVLVAYLGVAAPTVAYASQPIACQSTVDTSGGVLICPLVTTCSDGPVVITFTKAPAFAAGWAVSWQGVPSTGGSASATGTGTVVTVKPSTTSGMYVVDVMVATNATGATTTPTQTILGSDSSNLPLAIARASFRSAASGSATSTIMSWNLIPGGSIPKWAIVALPLNP